MSAEPSLGVTDEQARALVADARQVVTAAIRRHPIAISYLSAASIEAHAADIVLALAESGHLR